jgi:uncharacterized membrane protein YebE (DUF533 family)
MNAIELLGTLLGGAGGGQGSKILQDILGGGAAEGEPAAGQPNVQRAPAAQPPTAQRPTATVVRGEEPEIFKPKAAEPPMDEQAKVLVRAMLNATRADGRMDRDEEQRILKLLGQPTAAVVEFIRGEFEKPVVAVREFAWSVPLGLEEKVYAVSVGAILLDERTESEYLKELSHGLRLAGETCVAIHRRYGAPVIH